MHCKVATPKSIESKSKLRFIQDDITLNKEQLILRSIMDTFEGANMQIQYTVLGRRIDLYFHEYKLAIEVHEKGHQDRDFNYEVQIQKALEEKLSCKFIRINPDEKNFDIFKAQNEIFRHTKKSTKKLND